jgi:hypothetical protein
LPDPVVVADAQPAGSSPAADPSPVASRDLESLNATELQAWRMTGEMPSTSPVTASTAAPPAAAAVEGQPASTDAIAKPAGSDPAAPPAAAPAKGAEARIPELLSDRARERERADRAERRVAELERRHAQPPADARPAASSAAPAGRVKPDPEQFPYGTSDPGYVEALTDYKLAVHADQQRTEAAEGQRQARAREESARVVAGFEERAAAARSKHADFDAVALLAPTDIPPGSAADLWVLEDEAGAEILYHLQQPNNAAERKRILALGPRQQLKELVLLGHRLTTDPAAVRTTTAPPPPPTLATRPSPADAVTRALAMTGDEGTRAYIDAENARELARLKR